MLMLNLMGNKISKTKKNHKYKINQLINMQQHVMVILEDYKYDQL